MLKDAKFKLTQLPDFQEFQLDSGRELLIDTPRDEIPVLNFERDTKKRQLFFPTKLQVKQQYEPTILPKGSLDKFDYRT